MFDPKLKQVRASYSQNFLKNPSQARYLIDLAGINANDNILEVGPGGGILTEYLLQKANLVVAVEKDPELVTQLQQKFYQNTKLKLIQSDILSYKIELKKYKVFTNPPFSISSALIKKLIFIPNPADEIYIFLQIEFANRLLGKVFNTQLSVLVKAFYTVEIIYKFKSEDFSPVPSVEVVLVKLKKHNRNNTQLVDQALFIKFVACGFQTQKSYLQKSLESIFTYTQWKKLAKELGFEIKAKSSELNDTQWIGLFQAFISPLVSKEKRQVVEQANVL